MNKENSGRRFAPLKFLRKVARSLKPAKREKTVYFIPGMCYNCKVFDRLQLPAGFRRSYIEWSVPEPGESLADYARKMAAPIDSSQPFVLVGYSFGAVVMQEMNRFLRPEKSIVISSFKSRDEIPLLFQAVKMSGITSIISSKLYDHTDFITGAFNRLLLHYKNQEVAEYMTMVDPVYIRWAVERITQWVPDIRYNHLYHIHGTEDQIFPYEKLKNVIPIEGGDHLMVVKKADTVSAILNSILLMKEQQDA